MSDEENARKSRYGRWKKPNTGRELPPQLRRAKSGNAIASVWRGIRDNMYSGATTIPYAKLPPFASKLAHMFWEVTEDEVLDAITRGDPAWFVAWLLRIDQIDTAMIAAGFGPADRTSLMTCRYTVDGFRQAAEDRLRKLGGTWPPVAA